MGGKFPRQIKLWKYEIERLARRFGLSFPQIIYEEVSRDEMHEYAAYNGFPIRYHHWSFGQEYLDMQTSGRMGTIIYEMVVNTEPCYAYLYDGNDIATNKTVMAHVCGHADFFLNNVHFRHTPKGMHNLLADNAARLDAIRTEIGKERVDPFLEACLSADTMVDLFSPLIDRFPRPPSRTRRPTPKQPQKIKPRDPLPYYMDEVLNPEEFLEEQRRRIKKEEEEAIAVEKGLKTPPWPVRDILGFLLLYAPLEWWQVEILKIVREEKMFFFSGALTHVMNEGWASFVEENIMFREGVALDHELCSVARQAAAVLRQPPVGVNPYKIGLALWKDIRFRWDTGRHGDIWELCKYDSIRKRWDEFVIMKYLADRHGIGTERFWESWREFCALLSETREGRGSIPPEYFQTDQYVSEWLLYEKAESELSELRRLLEEVREFEEEVEKFFLKSRRSRRETKELEKFGIRYHLWLRRGSPANLLWTSGELQREISRREKLVAIRERFLKGEITPKVIVIPDEWLTWAKQNPQPIELGKGLEKIFEVRRTYNDVMFFEDFFTREFCEKEGYYTIGILHDQFVPELDPHSAIDVWAVRSRDWRRVKEFLKGMYLNAGMPKTELVDANYNGNRELYIRHLHDGRDLHRGEAKEVLCRIWLLWGGQKAVHLETMETEWPKKKPWWESWRPPGTPPPPLPQLKRKKVLYSCADGQNVTKKPLE